MIHRIFMIPLEHPANRAFGLIWPRATTAALTDGKKK
jgi:hypothetical protein